MTGAPEDDAELAAGAPRQPLGVWWVGVAGLAIAVLLLVSQNLRAYGYAVGATLFVLAALRALLPASRAGGLAVRGRAVDVATLLVLGAAVAGVAYTLRLGVP